MNFLENISNNCQKLNETEQILLKYFYNNLDRVNNLTIKKVCEENYIVPNTLVRFCKKLGFSGYSEFKTVFYTQSLNKKNIIDDISLDNQIAKTKELLNLNIIEKTIDSIYQAKKIIIVSFGLNRNVVNELTEKFQMIGLNCHTYIDTNVIDYNCSLLEKNDVLICFSISGNTKKILDCTNIAKSKGAITISITGFSTNPLSKITDYQLYSMISEKNFNGIDLTSRIGFFYIGNTIFESYFNKYILNNL